MCCGGYRRARVRAMAVQPGTPITVSRHLIFIVLAIVCGVIIAFLEFAKVAVEGNVITGLFALCLVFGWASFL